MSCNVHFLNHPLETSCRALHPTLLSSDSMNATFFSPLSHPPYVSDEVVKSKWKCFMIAFRSSQQSRFFFPHLYFVCAYCVCERLTVSCLVVSLSSSSSSSSQVSEGLCRLYKHSPVLCGVSEWRKESSTLSLSCWFRQRSADTNIRNAIIKLVVYYSYSRSYSILSLSVFTVVLLWLLSSSFVRPG
jgi:hypothetical protein